MTSAAPASQASLRIRIIANIGGRYQLTSKHDATGTRREFACRALSLSPRSMLLAAPVLGRAGERVVAHIEHLGRISGAIGKVMDRGFVMGIDCSDADRAQIANRLAWIDRFKNFDTPDARGHKRITPKNPHSRLLLPDGTVQTCLVIDMSRSGAAISADAEPKIGAPVAVGAVIGRVVRRFREGFAIKFVEVQDIERLEERLIRR